MLQVQLIDGASRDVRHAVRTLGRAPWFSSVAVLTLALGIGATTAIFSVINGVLLKPLPFTESDRLVGIYQHAPGINLSAVNQGAATFFTYHDHQRVFEGIGGWDRQQVSIVGRGEPERVEALAVTDATLPLLRVQPAIGQFFNREDDRPGSPLRVVLTHGYWQRKFEGNRSIIGQSIVLNGQPADIVGVLPASFKFLRTNPSVIVPLQPDRADMDGVSFGFQALARLKPGATLSDANADVARMIPLLNPIPGFSTLRLQPYVRPLAADVVGDIGPVLWILMATVGGVLVIACANVANLFLVRAEGRQKEIALRSALGASRLRIARELLAESLSLGFAAGAVGLLLANAGLAVLRQMAPATLPRIDDIDIDPQVLLFTLAVSLVSGVLFGLVPVLRLGGVDAGALKESGRGGTDARVRHRTRNTLAVAQVAMALVLLVGSGLMIRTFVAMRQMHPGFERPAQVQTFRIAIPDEVIADNGQFARTHEQIANRLQQVPGVASVGLSSHITMDGEDNGNPLRVEAVDVPDGTVPPLRRFKTIAPGYLETMGNHLVAGRAITWSDIHQARRVAVVSSALAREYWRSPSEALGKRVRAEDEWYEIVGVSADERDDGLNRPATAIIYWPLLNDTFMPRTIAYVVRSNRVGTPGFVRDLQQAVTSVNPNLPLAALLTLDEIVEESMAQTSFIMVMLVIAAMLALLLGTVGIYGVIAYVATRRTREIGIRLALGAQPRDVQGLLLRHGLVLTIVGIGTGVVLSLAVTRVMSTLLFGVGSTDLLTYASVSAGLAAIALLATWLPAFRASRLDPNTALRIV
jgi:putative ABC transport system permease protein